jgi:phage replication O-like protein O
MDESNYTKVPNELIDVAMRRMGHAEIKIVLAILRQTSGWHKPMDEISLTQFEALTGMTRANVINGIRTAATNRWIKHFKSGKSSFYSLSIEDGISAIPDSCGIAEIPEMVLQEYQNGIAAIPKVVSEQYTQKKEKKEKEKKENIPRDKSRDGVKRVRAKLSEEESLRHRELFDGIVRICVVDAKLQSGVVARTAKQLREADAGASGNTLDEFLNWWKAHDWRGKQGKPPLPSQILSAWRQFKEGFAEIPKAVYNTGTRGMEMANIIDVFGDLIKEKNG